MSVHTKGVALAVSAVNGSTIVDMSGTKPSYATAGAPNVHFGKNGAYVCEVVLPRGGQDKNVVEVSIAAFSQRVASGKRPFLSLCLIDGNRHRIGGRRPSS
jgi:hypothetical protein